ncbi:MAG: ZIP family metal transporter [bacterium]
MFEIWVYTLVSVTLISLVAFVGILSFPLQKKTLKNSLLFLVSFAAGSLLGGAFIHLLPEAIEESGFTTSLPLFILLGIIIFFTIEKFLHWQHCHSVDCDKHPKSLAIINLVGDGFHNFIDGLIIGGSYLVSIPLGIATSIAVLLHEVPQEIGDFGVLLHGGFSRRRALFFNFLSALTAVLGAIVALVLFDYVGGLTKFLIPFTIGGFIYIAASDLIPELHKETDTGRSFISLLSFILGILVMLLLLLFE